MKYWVFLFSVLVTACSQSSSVSRGMAGSEKQRLANEIRSKVASQLKQEANLRPCGTMGQMMNEIQRLGLSFYYFQPVDIVEGRKLAVKAVETMLQEINQDMRIHPYLICYPFKPRNIEITIFLRNPDNSDPPPESLQVIKASEGVLRYKIDNSTRKGFVTIYKETYEEALDRVADPSLPPVSFQPDRELSAEDLTLVRKGIYYLSNDGAIYHPGENGNWVKRAK